MLIPSESELTSNFISADNEISGGFKHSQQRKEQLLLKAGSKPQRELKPLCCTSSSEQQLCPDLSHQTRANSLIALLAALLGRFQSTLEVLPLSQRPNGEKSHLSVNGTSTAPRATSSPSLLIIITSPCSGQDPLWECGVKQEDFIACFLSAFRE